MFFSEEKNQKTFVFCAAPAYPAMAGIHPWAPFLHKRTSCSYLRYPAMTDLPISRRNLLSAPMLLGIASAEASPLNPAQTMITLPDHIPWEQRKTFPKDSVASATLAGGLNEPGLYYELIKWYPGYMSAPHTYITDRLCVVLSGTWWVNSGADFDPASCMPVPAGSFVRRVAHTPHYDGVIATGQQPAVIAICGMGPAGMHYIDSSKPGWRRV